MGTLREHVARLMFDLQRDKDALPWEDLPDDIRDMWRIDSDAILALVASREAALVKALEPFANMGSSELDDREPFMESISPAAIRAARAALAPVKEGAEPSAAVRDVIEERRRQIQVEGWTDEHDDLFIGMELAAAGASYALASHEPAHPPLEWPWAPEWWKPKSRRQNLVRSAALIVAEIDRLDRAALAPVKEGEV